MTSLRRCDACDDLDAEAEMMVPLGKADLYLCSSCRHAARAFFRGEGSA